MPLTRRLYIIGSGPGGLEHLSPAAHAALESCTNLTGHGLIAKRIDLTGQGDFAIAFLQCGLQQTVLATAGSPANPAALSPAETLVIVAFNVTRKGEQITVTTLGELDLEPLNMLSLVLIGGSEMQRMSKLIISKQKNADAPLAVARIYMVMPMPGIRGANT